MKYGLSDKQFSEMISVISNDPVIKKVILFGSRALGTFKNTSDIDLAVLGEKVDFFAAASLKNKLEEETVIPFFLM